jgi:tryptophan-rich sensory protein
MSFAVHSRPSFPRPALWQNVLGAVVVALVANAIVFVAGWDSSSQTEREPSFAPPGYVIGGIWLALFGCMGAARSLFAGAKTANAQTLKRAVTALIVLCATYPFYTSGLDNRYVALAGAVVTLVLSAVIAVRGIHASRAAAALVGLVTAWSIFAAALVVRGIQLN